MLESFRMNGLVKYSYCYGNHYNWKKYGDYQCDVADFRQFWRHMRRDRLMSCGCVDFASGDRFIFYRRGEQVRWEYLGKDKATGSGTDDEGKVGDVGGQEGRQQADGNGGLQVEAMMSQGEEYFVKAGEEIIMAESGADFGEVEGAQDHILSGDNDGLAVLGSQDMIGR